MAEVMFVNSFQVPPGSDEEFLALWSDVNTYAQSKPRLPRWKRFPYLPVLYEVVEQV